MSIVGDELATVIPPEPPETSVVADVDGEHWTRPRWAWWCDSDTLTWLDLLREFDPVTVVYVPEGH